MPWKNLIKYVKSSTDSLSDVGLEADKVWYGPAEKPRTSSWIKPVAKSALSHLKHTNSRSLTKEFMDQTVQKNVKYKKTHQSSLWIENTLTVPICLSGKKSKKSSFFYPQNGIFWGARPDSACQKLEKKRCQHRGVFIKPQTLENL